ncbi:MAG: PVC-type heme-binding CxxCH protein, partial [Planctomycetia bacterium]
MTSLTAAIAITCLAAWCPADDFPEPPDTEKDAAARPLAAAAAAAGFRDSAGLEVTVFAAEPDVRNPIALAWDGRGRLWVAENYSYAGRPTNLEPGLRDRVVVFEDADADGRPDGRRVFHDDLRQLTSVEVGLGGVWLLCPPQLLFVPDADGDARPDGPPIVVLDGFDVAGQNHHNFANGLRFGPDGWLYGRCGASCPGLVGRPGATETERVALAGGVWRYDPVSRRVEAVCHGTTNPWGHDWNAFGDGFFINTVNGHLWQIIPGAHYVRAHTVDPNPYVYELIDTHADHWHFDVAGGWQKSRDGAANDFGGGHAHSGAMIYLGDDWPAEMRGDLFTWNLHGRRANRERLERRGSGYVGRHRPDVLVAADPFFRGIELSCGPDGAVYALDWSDTGECHEATGVHRSSGRIYRIANRAGGPKRPRPDLPGLATADLVALVTHANEWHVRQARLELAARAGGGPLGRLRAEFPADPAATRPAFERLVTAADPLVACRGLLAAHGSGIVDTAWLRRLLRHENEHLRVWAVRLIVDSWPLDGVQGPLPASRAVADRVAAGSAGNSARRRP